MDKSDNKSNNKTADDSDAPSLLAKARRDTIRLSQMNATVVTLDGVNSITEEPEDFPDDIEDPYKTLAEIMEIILLEHEATKSAMQKIDDDVTDIRNGIREKYEELRGMADRQARHIELLSITVKLQVKAMRDLRVSFKRELYDMRNFIMSCVKSDIDKIK